MSSIYAADTYIEDLGPDGIFLSSQQAAARKGDDSRLWAVVAGAIDCHKCLSLWLAAGLLLLRVFSRPLYLFVTIPLTVSFLADARLSTRQRRLHETRQT